MTPLAAALDNLLDALASDDADLDDPESEAAFAHDQAAATLADWQGTDWPGRILDAVRNAQAATYERGWRCSKFDDDDREPEEQIRDEILAALGWESDE